MNQVARTPGEVHIGDLIRYPARLVGREEFSDRDLLRVSRVEGGFVFGYREHPDEWERDVEFAVYPTQLSERGVVILGRPADRPISERLLAMLKAGVFSPKDKAAIRKAIASTQEREPS